MTKPIYKVIHFAEGIDGRLQIWENDKLIYNYDSDCFDPGWLLTHLGFEVIEENQEEYGSEEDDDDLSDEEDDNGSGFRNRDDRGDDYYNQEDEDDD